MRTHLTTTSGDAFLYAVLADVAWDCTLVSYAYRSCKPLYEITWRAVRNHVLVDSGAFTLWTRGITIDLADLIAWNASIKREWSDRMASLRFINLDVIPGALRRPPTRAQIERGMTDSLANADAMRAAGFDTIEVYHQNEPLDFLDTLLDRLPERGVLAISPDNSVSLASRRAYLTRTLQHLMRDRQPSDLPRMHGLGVTSTALTLAFPFYSVDSSSWMTQLRFGVNRRARLPYIPRGRGVARHSAGGVVLRQEIERARADAARATRLWSARGVRWSD